MCECVYACEWVGGWCGSGQSVRPCYLVSRDAVDDAHAKMYIFVYIICIGVFNKNVRKCMCICVQRVILARRWDVLVMSVCSMFVTALELGGQRVEEVAGFGRLAKRCLFANVVVAIVHDAA